MDRALVELEDDPAHGLIEAHLVAEVELQELALLFGGRGSSPAPDLLNDPNGITVSVSRHPSIGVDRKWQLRASNRRE